jgi:RNA polymerase sigma-70 factor (ECF subfamily)
MRDDLPGCDDEELLRRARSDPDAFGELVRRHQAAALRLAAVVCGSTDRAPDVVQEAFVAAYRHAASYRADAPALSWLLRIVANHAKNEVRSRQRRLRRDDRHARLMLRDEGSADIAAEVTELTDRRVERQRLAVALAQLPVGDREVLGCRFVAGLSEAETADVLAVAVGTVKSRTSRALGRLRGALDPIAGGVRVD